MIFILFDINNHSFWSFIKEITIILSLPHPSPRQVCPPPPRIWLLHCSEGWQTHLRTIVCRFSISYSCCAQSDAAKKIISELLSPLSNFILRSCTRCGDCCIIQTLLKVGAGSVSWAFQFPTHGFSMKISFNSLEVGIKALTSHFIQLVRPV